MGNRLNTHVPDERSPFNFEPITTLHILKLFETGNEEQIKFEISQIIISPERYDVDFTCTTTKYYNLLIACCYHNYINEIKQLVRIGAKMYDSNWNILQAVAASPLASVELIDFFVDEGVKFTQPTLHVACDVEKTKKLLECGANPKRINNKRETALFYAKSPEQTELLIKHGCDPSIKNYKGETALFYAKCSEQANLLIKHGCDPGIKNYNEETALFYAKTLKQVKILIKSGVNPNSQNKEGNTAMFYAKTPRRVELLMQLGADPTIKNKRGETAVSYAKGLSTSKQYIDYEVDRVLEDLFEQKIHCPICKDVICY